MKLFLMRSYWSLVFITLYPVSALAQVATDTGAGDNVDSLFQALGAVWNAFTSGGVLVGMGAVFAALATVMNFTPLKTFLAKSRFDWIRPLIMLISVTGGAFVGALLTDVTLWASVMAGLTTGVASGWVQKFIQDVRD